MNKFDITIDSKLDYIAGESRLLTELEIYSINHDRISYNWFRKLCRRCGLSSIKARTDLFNMEYIEKRDMPCKLSKRSSEFNTYDDWKKLGYCVQQGHVSYARNMDGVAVFSNNQVCLVDIIK